MEAVRPQRRWRPGRSLPVPAAKLRLAGAAQRRRRLLGAQPRGEQLHPPRSVDGLVGVVSLLADVRSGRQDPPADVRQPGTGLWRTPLRRPRSR